MTIEQSQLLSERLNSIGVLVYWEVNGVQHRFKLNLRELAPTSVVYETSKKNIENPQFTLIPVVVASKIHGIGKALFNPEFENRMKSEKGQMTGLDYVNTDYGRFVSKLGVNKMLAIGDILVNDMRVAADQLVSKDYESNYRNSFLFALNFFSQQMRDFRSELHRYDGKMQLFWKEVERIYKDFEGIKAIFQKRRPRGRLSINDLETAELRTAYKMSGIPRSYDKYRISLGFYFRYTGFHPWSLAKWEWNEKYWLVKDLATARSMLFKPYPLPLQTALTKDDDE